MSRRGGRRAGPPDAFGVTELARLGVIVAVCGAYAWLVHQATAGAVTGSAATVLLHATPPAFYLLLAFLFGRTLRAGQVALITRFALLEHDPLPEELRRYTRGLTLIWTCFFIVMALAAVAFSLFAHIETWALLTNVVIYALMAALFVSEYVYRRLRYAHYDHLSLPAMLLLVLRSWRTVWP